MNWYGLGSTIKWMGLITMCTGIVAMMLSFDATLIRFADPNPFITAIIKKTLSEAAPRMIHTGATAALIGVAMQVNASKEPRLPKENGDPKP